MNKTMIAVLIATISTPLALGEHTPEGLCDSGDAPALGIMRFDAPNGGIYYIDDRNYILGNGIWLYEETNGIIVNGDNAHSLQRGGASAYVPDDSEICVDDPLVVPDTLIF